MCDSSEKKTHPIKIMLRSERETSDGWNVLGNRLNNISADVFEVAEN